MADPVETAFTSHVAALAAGDADAPLLVSERSPGAIATVTARSGQVEALRAAVRERLGLEIANDACRIASGGRAMIGIGPGNWLFVGDEAGPDTVPALADALSGLASVFDQSSGYAILRIEGDTAAALLGKGAYIDLHPAAFPPGRAAVTVIAHIDAILWRVSRTAYEIAIFRSYADSFWHWLATASAAMGIMPCLPLPSCRRGDENASG